MSNLILNQSEGLIEIPSQTEYWFVRTDFGEHYDTYYENDFIAIGWNYITLEDISIAEKNPTLLAQKIISNQGLNPSSKQTKGKVTRIINKLIAFKNLKKNDVIIIPSRGSSFYAFGTVVDDFIYTDPLKSYNCEYYKRRKIEWYVEKPIHELDPNFFRMRFTQHTISRIDDYSKFIDNVMNGLYRKNDYAFFSFDIKTEKDVNADDLLSLISLIKTLMKEANLHFQYKEDVESTAIRINLQSPGSITFKQMAGRSLLTVGMILTTIGCSSDKNNLDQKIQENNRTFVTKHKDTLNDVINIMDSMEGSFRNMQRNHGRN